MLLQIENSIKDMNSEVVRNFKMHMKDFQKGKKIVKQYIFTCKNCNQEISMPDGAQISPKNRFSTDYALSCHLMTCEKYQDFTTSSPPAASRAI